jgi:hydroxymethylbilane synthase
MHQNRPPKNISSEIGGKGLFIKRLEQALLDGEADFAVHSMKDVPPALSHEFCLPAVLQRASPLDALVSVKYKNLKDLPKHAVVGTSSVRRTAQLKHIRPDLQIRSVRGNVDTRLSKLHEGQFDALILAEAGLDRLGLASHIREIFSSNVFLPSVGQGAIGIECLANHKELQTVLSQLNHLETQACIHAERAMNAAIGARCDSPVGSFAEILSGQLMLRGEVLNREGSKKITAAAEGNMLEAENLGFAVARMLLEQGAKDLF